MFFLGIENHSAYEHIADVTSATLSSEERKLDYVNSQTGKNLGWMNIFLR